MASFTYKSYNFIDKDPLIDEIRTIYEDSGANYDYVHANSGVAVSTLINWFSGQTKRPQAATVNAVLRSLGYKLGVVPYADVVKIIPAMPQPKPRAITTPAKAADQAASARHIVQMAKYKGGKR
jgi:hypothetical protein